MLKKSMILLLMGNLNLSGCSQQAPTPVTHIITPAIADYTYAPTIAKLIPFEDENTKLMGYKDQFGTIKIKAQFIKALPFSKYEIADVCQNENNWYKINSFGHILFKSYFFDNGPDYYAHDLMRFIKNNKIGFANITGKIVIPAQFDFALPFSFDAPVTLACIGCHYNQTNGEISGGKWGVIDTNGKIIVPFEFKRDKHARDITLYKDQKNYKLYSDLVLRENK